MRHVIPALAAAAGLCAIGAPAALAQTNIAIVGGLGTTGGSLELEYGLSSRLVLRGGVNRLGYDIDDSYDGVDYAGEAKLENVGLFADLHPFANPFLLSAGAYVGDKSLSGVSAQDAAVEIGGVVYTSAQAGRLSLEAMLDDAAPFLGLGYDNALFGDGHFGFRLIAGAMFSGSPEVSLTSEGGVLSSNPVFLAALESERQAVESEIDDYGVLPVVQAGISYRF